ncbi:MAG: sigma-54 dependent transcriptional regulator [Pseudomonadota bacterium]
MKESLYPTFGILLVDDEAAWLRSMRISLARLAEITHVTTCQDSREVMGLIEKHDIGMVLLDLTMPHLSGEAVLEMIGEQYPEVIVIVVSGMNQIETAVKCMKQGAFDYLVKTDEEGRILTVILHAIRMIEMQREHREMSRRFFSDTLRSPGAFSEIITVNPAMRSVFLYIDAVAKSTQPLLITGESGVGKGLIARAVHQLSGAAGELVSVNVGGLDDAMLTDTLFGHVKGAFTGADHARSGMIEKAAHGTLFLDEIGELSNVSQVKLLRLLQEGDYYPLGSDQPKRLKARVVASTHQDLEKRQALGLMRKDLYYRLRAHHVTIPALRDRREDIAELFDHFLEEACRGLAKPRPTVSRRILPLLEAHDFPGNIRELRSMIFDAVARCGDGTLAVAHFSLLGHPHGQSEGLETINTDDLFDAVKTLPTIHEAVRSLIQAAIKRAKGNQTVAAQFLGISQPALSKRLRLLQED